MAAAARFGRVQKATALVPLALLSAAWTAGIAGVGGTATASVSASTGGALPDGTTVPEQAIEDAASVTAPGVLAAAVPPGRAGAASVVSTASASGIPAAALAAYQRAETVINTADAGCNLDWELLAAIGRVESDHGRFGGNTLDDDGVARPGIFGIALDGTKDTLAIRDTDAGQYDGDGVWDRAVGPMQFIPSTWSVVGVDADGDGTRNPQDVDDAALASAVYLCSGVDDLSTDAGRRAAVFRYNRSGEYVDLVLSVMAAYQRGDFSSVPNATTSATVFVPATAGQSGGVRGGSGAPGVKTGAAGVKGGSGSGVRGGDGGGGTGGGTKDVPKAPPTSGPQDGPKAGVPDGGGDPASPLPEQEPPSTSPLSDPTKVVQDTVKGTGEAGSTAEGGTGGGGDSGGTSSGDTSGSTTLTYAEAKAKCLRDGVSDLELPACIARLLD